MIEKPAEYSQEQVVARVQLLQTLARAFDSPTGNAGANPGTRVARDAGAAGEEGAALELVRTLRESVGAHPAADELREPLCAVEAAARSQADGAGPAIEHEFTYLFRRKTKVPLTEGSYGLDLTFGRPREMADIGAFHEAFGFRVASDCAVPPDHMSAQLEFVALLCIKEAHAASRGWREQAEITRHARANYLTDHLTGWLPVFRRRLEQHARAPFFPKLAGLAEAGVRWEHREVAAEPPRSFERSLRRPRNPAATGTGADADAGAETGAGVGAVENLHGTGVHDSDSSSFPCGGCPVAGPQEGPGQVL